MELSNNIFAPRETNVDLLLCGDLPLGPLQMRERRDKRENGFNGLLGATRTKNRS